MGFRYLRNLGEDGRLLLVTSGYVVSSQTVSKWCTTKDLFEEADSPGEV